MRAHCRESDRLGGVARAGLHLDEDDLAGQLDHEVELALGAAPAGGAHAAAVGLVAAGGAFLGGEAEVMGAGEMLGRNVLHAAIDRWRAGAGARNGWGTG